MLRCSMEVCRTAKIYRDCFGLSFSPFAKLCPIFGWDSVFLIKAVYVYLFIFNFNLNGTNNTLMFQSFLGSASTESKNSHLFTLLRQQQSWGCTRSRGGHSHNSWHKLAKGMSHRTLPQIQQQKLGERRRGNTTEATLFVFPRVHHQIWWALLSWKLLTLPVNGK